MDTGVGANSPGKIKIRLKQKFWKKRLPEVDSKLADAPLRTCKRQQLVLNDLRLEPHCSPPASLVVVIYGVVGT